MTTTLKKGTIKRLHVDQHVIKRNRKEGRSDPAVTIQTSRGPIKAMRVAIEGPSELVYSPDKPLACGAHVWVETRAEVNYEGAKR